MLEIEELMLNMCDFKGTICGADFETNLKMLIDEARQAGGKDVTGVYLGFEFCPNMLSRCRIKDVVEKIQFVKERGFSVLWVIPPLYERHVDMYRDFLKILFSCGQIDACVVNDFGALHMLRGELQWKKTIHMGRLFDKSTREVRMDVGVYPEIIQNEAEFVRPGFCNDEIQKIAARYQVSGFETDTISHTILNLEEWGDRMQIFVHYPRILLSRAAYCEFDAVTEERKRKFLLRTACTGVCDSCERIIYTEDQREIHKSGLAIISFQEKTIEEAVSGKICMVYSKR